MKIYTKTGVMDITLRPLSDNMQGDFAIPDRNVGILIDIVFTSDDGERKWAVMSGEGDPIDFVVPGDHPFYFTSNPDAIRREYPKEIDMREVYTKRDDLLEVYPDYLWPYEAPDGEIVNLVDLLPDTNDARELMERVKVEKEALGEQKRQ